MRAVVQQALAVSLASTTYWVRHGNHGFEEEERTSKAWVVGPWPGGLLVNVEELTSSSGDGPGVLLHLGTQNIISVGRC